MATKKTNGSNSHISIDREEYEALRTLRDESHALLIASHARLSLINQEMIDTIKAQVTRIGLLDVRCTGLEQLVLLRREIVSVVGTEMRVEMRIPMARVASRPTIDAIIKNLLATPDVTDVAIFDHLSRRLHPECHASDAHTRAEHEAAGPKKQSMLQTHMIHQLQGDNAKLHVELEARIKELEKLKADAVAGVSKPQEGKS